jgi:hypothetical protein
VNSEKKKLGLTDLKPAGWLALIVIALVVLGGGILVGRSLWRKHRGLAGLRSVEYTPAPAPPTLRDVEVVMTPTSVPAPRGWTEAIFAGTKYLAPPVEVEAQIWEAFGAVLACRVVTDAPDGELLEYDRVSVTREAMQFAPPDVFNYACAGLMESPRQEGCPVQVAVCAEFGLENPVQCQSRDVCTVVLTRKEATGFLVFDHPGDGQCVEDALGGLCLVRDDLGDEVSGVLYVATVEESAGQWVVTNWYEEALPQ